MLQSSWPDKDDLITVGLPAVGVPNLFLEISLGHQLPEKPCNIVLSLSDFLSEQVDVSYECGKKRVRHTPKARIHHQ